MVQLPGFILEKANSLVNSYRNIEIANTNDFSWSEAQKIEKSPVGLVHISIFTHTTAYRGAVKLWLKSQGKKGDFCYSISKLTALYSLSVVWETSTCTTAHSENKGSPLIPVEILKDCSLWGKNMQKMSQIF